MPRVAVQTDVLVDSTSIFKRRRYFVVVLAFFGFFNMFSQRLNLSVGIVAMTENKTIAHDDGTVTYQQAFDWDSKQKGFVLSAFFYGYIATQLLGGVLASRFGGHLPFGIGIAVKSVMNLLVPLAAEFSIYALIVTKTIDGLFEVSIFQSF